MPDSATAFEQKVPATVGLLTPSAEDKQWEKAVAAKAAGFWKRDRAEAFLADKLVEALRGKQLWRVNHLLTTTYARRIPLSSVSLGKASVPDIARNMYRLYGFDSDKAKKNFPNLNSLGSDSSLAAVAVESKYYDTLKLLIDRGTVTPEEAVKKSIRDSQPALLEALERDIPGVLAKPIEVYESYGVRQVSTLTAALKSGADMGTFNCLLKYNLQAVNQQSLYDAINTGNGAAAVTLIEKGADTSDAPNGYSPLMHAVRCGVGEAVKAILDKGVEDKYRDTLGGDLLRAMVDKKEGSRNPSASVASIILERLPVGANELREVLQDVPVSSTLYKLLNAAASSQEPQGPWRLMGPQQVGTVSRDASANVALVEIFNFATSQHMILSRNPQTHADALLLRENFADMANKDVIEAARAHLAPKAKAAPVAQPAP